MDEEVTEEIKTLRSFINIGAYYYEKGTPALTGIGFNITLNKNLYTTIDDILNNELED